MMISTNNYQYGDAIEIEHLDDKDEILSFMRSLPDDGGIAAGYFCDVVTGEEITTIPDCLFECSGFLWDSCDLYHFDKYDLKLSDEFKAFVRSKIND